MAANTGKRRWTESSSVHFFQVTAIDLDKGPNGDVEYSLLGDSEDSRFRIHRKTGEISVKRPLDSEDQNREYNLRVQATDKGRSGWRSWPKSVYMCL